jgi:hypothetical protein
MMGVGKAVLATVAATILLGAVVGSASARNFSISNQFLTATFRRVTFEGPGLTIVCEVVVEGSFHRRTTAKRVGSLVGYLTSAAFGAGGCEAGRATILRETLPWHIRYLGFAGTLPNITSIIANIVRSAFRIQEPFATCLGTSTEANPTIVTFNRDVVTRVLTTATIGGTIPTSCGVNGTFRSDAAQVFLLGTTNRLTLTLI